MAPGTAHTSFIFLSTLPQLGPHRAMTPRTSRHDSAHIAPESQAMPRAPRECCHAKSPSRHDRRRDRHRSSHASLPWHLCSHASLPWHRSSHASLPWHRCSHASLPTTPPHLASTTTPRYCAEVLRRWRSYFRKVQNKKRFDCRAGFANESMAPSSVKRRDGTAASPHCIALLRCR